MNTSHSYNELPDAMTDQELKMGLLEMLPDVLREDFGTEGDDLHFEWKHGKMRIKDTEWLHVCSLAEAALEGEERLDYVNTLFEQFSEGVIWDEASTRLVFFPFICAGWQQRAAAMIKLRNTRA